MGWSQHLSHNGITEKQVEAVLTKIKAGGFFGGKWAKQDWGWHSECDIRLNEKYISFGGAWSMSGNTALPERFLIAALELKLPVGTSLSERS